MLPTEQILMWQQLFTLLSNLPTDSIPDPIAGKMRSYLTESHRLLRLLPIDLTLIAAARNPDKLQQRRQAYQEKLDLLLQYCQAVIKM
jgi:hypothetical protein